MRWGRERLGEGGGKEREGRRKKGENVSDSVCVGKEICTRDTARKRKDNRERMKAKANMDDLINE